MNFGKAYLKRAVMALVAIGVTMVSLTPTTIADELADPLFRAELQDRLVALDETGKEIQWSRLAILVGGFTELDLGILEMKVQPYVELRFNRVQR